MSDTDSENFQPIHNPYIVGNPIKDERMFFGREDDFLYIKQKVTGGKKGGLLVLCGMRRSGKTSILFQIMNGRLGDEFFPVLIDMQAMTVENDLDFLIKIANGIIDAIGDGGISLERDFLARRNEGSLAAFQHLIVKFNEQLGGKKLVLLFDEYEIFESHIANKLISTEILHLFANWIEHKEGVFIVFTGSDKLEERKAEYWGHFLGKALHRRISFLSKADTLRLVEEPLRGIVDYEKRVPEQIYSLTAGLPFYIQVFCQTLIDHLNETRERTVTLEALQSAIDQVIENPLPQMIFSWNSLTNLEKLALSIIGELTKDSATVTAKEILAFAKKQRIGFQIDTNALSEALEKLFHHDMLRKIDDGGAYTFRMDLWRRWMARMHSIWQVIDEIKSGGDELGTGLSRAKPAGRRWALVAGAAVIGVVGVGWFGGFGRGGRTSPGLIRTNVDSTRVTIQTIPENADVFLGKTRIGKSPIRGQLVPAGIVQLRIERDGYRDYVDSLEIAKDTPFYRSISLVDKTGGLRMESTPRGARIHINGKPTDLVTPATIPDLSVNRPYEVKITLADYNTKEFPNVRVYEDSTYQLWHDFARATAHLQVETNPPGARIYVDDVEVGLSPTVRSFAYGPHRLALKKEGHAEHQQEVRIPDVGFIRVDLHKLPPGTLVITVNPWADIWINGVLKKEKADTFEELLDAGRYTIELRNPQYKTRKADVQMESNGRIERTFDLTIQRN
jgi:hypothetical protein